MWWRVARSGPRTPLLLLHGGPGAGHDYLEPLSALADERPVIFYDQLGCGRSDRPDDASMWHIEHFVEAIDALRQALRPPSCSSLQSLLGRVAGAGIFGPLWRSYACRCPDPGLDFGLHL